MSETKNLRLFKHNEPLETNENKFDIDLALNQNWDKIEEFAGMVNDKVIELEDKDEEQDFNLQELQNEIKKDRENMINLEVEGQSIHIEDSSDLEGQLEVLGNAEQDTREGYNLLNLKEWSVSENSNINIVGEMSENEVRIRTNKTTPSIGYFLRFKKILPTGTYYFQRKYEEIKKGTGGGNYGLIFISKSDWSKEYCRLTPTDNKKSFTLEAETEVVMTLMVKGGTDTGTEEREIRYYDIMLSNKDEEFEKYGKSPSPEYPSEIRAVGDNINLLENTAKTQTVNGVTFTVNEDGTVIANGTATSLAQISLVANLKLSAGTYTIKDAKAYVESTEFNDWFDGLNNSSTLTFNTEVLLKNVYIQVKQGETVNNKIFYPKLEKGTVATNYSKYGQGSVEIKKQNKNIILIKPNQKVVTRGLTVETDDNARITINGIAENTTYLKLYKEIAGTYLSEAEKWEKEKIAKGNYRLSIQNLKGNYNTGNPNILMRNSPNSNTEISYLLQKLNKDKSIKCTIDKSMEVMWYMYIQKDVIFNNFSFELLLEKTEMNEYSNYILGEEQTYTLPIQKPMLEEDHFNRTDNKEVHTWKKIVLDGVNNKVTQTTTNQSGKYRYQYIDKDLKDCSLSEEKAYCTHLPLIGKSKTYDKILGFTVANNSVYIYTDGDTASNFNAKLQKENYIFYIPVIESAYEKIDLTSEQIKVLDELDNFPTYKPVTNITTDSIAKLKLKYIADTKTYVDNKTSNLEQQVSVINQLLSTTKTSSILLDNLQKDIESEVL